MTLDRTKKYKVGRLEFRYDPEYSKLPNREWWRADASTTGNFIRVLECELIEMCPVEVEEPIKWSVETGGGQFGWIGDSYFSTMFKSKAGQPLEGHWRHEVVSTRIG